MPEWLEQELSHQLAPTQAPDALWDRIQQARRRERGPFRPFRRALPVAAIVTLMIAAGTLWFVARGEQPSAQPNVARARIVIRQVMAQRPDGNCLACHSL